MSISYIEKRIDEVESKLNMCAEGGGFQNFNGADMEILWLLKNILYELADIRKELDKKADY